MKILVVLLCWLCVSFFDSGLHAQIDSGFKKMVEGHYENFPLISPEVLNNKLEKKTPLVILDTREKDEFNVSHVPGALYFGYDKKNWKALTGVSEDAEIIVYCSIGVRSQNIGKELAGMGFTNVKNLYGGVFLWADQQRMLEDSRGKTTNKVHGYDPYWGKWVKKAEVVYE